MIQNSNAPYKNIKSLTVNDDDVDENDKNGEYDNDDTIKKDKNKWCCCHISLPITGKLEKKTLTFIVITLLIDLAANLLLFFTTHHWWFLDGHSLTWFTWNDFHNDFKSFTNGTSDTILLWLIRVVSLIILSYIVIHKGVPNDLWTKKQKNKSKTKYNNKRNKKDTTYSIQRLLNDDDNNNKALVLSSNIQNQSKNNDKNDKNDTDDTLYQEIEGIVDKRKLQPQFDNKMDQESYISRKEKAIGIKYGILLIMFLIMTIYQGYIGVKCVTFNFLSNSNKSFRYETCQAILYGIIVLSINIEVFLFKIFLESATDLGESIIVLTLHQHPLIHKTKVKYWCDLCRSRAKYGTYRCDGCRFDVCTSCFKKERKKLLKQQKEKEKLKSKNISMKHGGKLGVNININAASSSYKYTTNEQNKPENDPTNSVEKEITSSGYLIRGLKLCLPHKTLIIIAFLCLAINSLASLLLPQSQGRIIDKIIHGNTEAFKYQVKYYLIVSVIVGLFGSIRNLCFAFIMRRLMVSIRSLLFRNIIVQDIEFFDDMSTGELISRMTNDVGGMLSPLRTMLATTLSNIILLIGGLIMCFITSWRLSMLAFTTVAPVLFLTAQYAKWSKNINRAIWAAFGSSTAIASQAFSNIRTIRAFGTEIKEISNYDNALKEILERGLINAIASTTTFALTNYLDLGAAVLILYFGGISILDNDKSNYELTVGKLITFQLYWNMINNAYKGLQNVLTSFTRGAGAAQRVLTLLDNIGKHNHNLYSGIELDKHIGLDGNILIDNVHFRYKTRPEAPVLQGINLEIKPGQVIALVGKSGGGKSTLIHLLMRFYDVNSGCIYYNKSKLKLNEMNLTQLRHNIGLVAQDTQLFDCTIRENIIYGIVDRDEDDIPLAEVIHYAKLANCHEFINKFEEGYSTRVGERGVRLSGGQKQRIAIARMLMKRPKILFLDEATSNLDTESEALVQSAIDKTIWYKHQNDDDEKYENDDDKQYKFRANAVILVAHRLSTVINADKIAVINQGKIVELGNHEELLNLKDGVYHKLVQRQIQRETNQLNQDDDNNNDNDTNTTTKKKDSKSKLKNNKKSKKVTKKVVHTDDIDSLFD